MSGALRVGNDRIQSWFALYQERSTSLGVVSLGLCEVRGSSGSRGTLDVSWSLLRPRSVAANSRWAVGTVESGAGAVRFTGSGAVPLGVPEEDPSWEIRIRIEPLLPLSRRSDPG